MNIRKTYDATIDAVFEGERSVVATITTDTVDRDGDIVLPSGADLKEYRRNPVVLWMHGQDHAVTKLPIGRNLWIKPTADKRALVAKTVFADHEWANEVFKLYQSGVLKGWSIGFQPTKAGAPDASELKSRPEWKSAKRVFRSWRLFEYSAVDIPANPDALTSAVSRGFEFSDAIMKRFASLPTLASPALPPLHGRKLQDIKRELERRMAVELGRYTPSSVVRDAVDVAMGRV